MGRQMVWLMVFLGLHAGETVPRVMKLWVCTCLESVDEGLKMHLLRLTDAKGA